MEKIKILAIETSCDETAAAVIEEQLLGDVDAEATKSQIESGMTTPVILSNVVSSSVDLHALTGGIVPEVASRAQIESIIPVISQAAGKDLGEITHIAVTAGPGLIGSLLVGFNAAKAIAYSRDLPIIPINHIEGHIYSAFDGKFPIPASPAGGSNFQFPILSLTVSGGHTSLTLMRDHGKYEQVGATIDDAVGEAYDKVAQLLGLGYPGGPAISKYAERFRNDLSLNIDHCPSNEKSRPPIEFPRPIINDGTFNFSFSGLKTAVLVKVKKMVEESGLAGPAELDDGAKEEICAAFEEAVADVLATKLGRAIETYNPEAVVFAGGVSANEFLRNSLKLKVESLKRDIQFLTPEPGLCGDNAAMIGLAAYWHTKRGDVSDWKSVEVDSNLKLA